MNDPLLAHTVAKVIWLADCRIDAMPAFGPIDEEIEIKDELRFACDLAQMWTVGRTKTRLIDEIVRVSRRLETQIYGSDVHWGTSKLLENRP